MYRSGTLSLAVVLATVISASTAMAGDPVTDAKRYNNAQDRVTHDGQRLNFDNARKGHDIDDFANSVRKNDLGGAVRDVIDIQKDNQNAHRDQGRLMGDRFRERAAKDQLGKDF
jgi:hypothetical protein